MTKGTSPTVGPSPILPTPSPGYVPESFPEAIAALTEGAEITRLDWDNANIYGKLRDGKVMICLDDGKWRDWIICDGDLLATDWVILS